MELWREEISCLTGRCSLLGARLIAISCLMMPHLPSNTRSFRIRPMVIMSMVPVSWSTMCRFRCHSFCKKVISSVWVSFYLNIRLCKRHTQPRCHSLLCRPSRARSAARYRYGCQVSPNEGLELVLHWDMRKGGEDKHKAPSLPY